MDLFKNKFSFFSTTNEALLLHCKRFGKIANCYIKRNEEGISQGYAYVTFDGKN